MISLRTFARGCVAVALAILVANLAETFAVAEAGDLEIIRSRVLAPLLAPVDAKDAGKLIDSMQSEGRWADIDYASKSRSSWPPPTHLSRVNALARAYRAPKSPQHGNREVLDAALKGLDAWLQLDPRNPNWWWNEIGVPRSMLPILLLLDEELSAGQRESGLKILRRAKIGMTGQNLVWVTEITAGRGLLERDAELVAKAYRRIAEEIHVSLSEGIQPDFSFHQHGPCLYSHGYGAGFIVDCSRIASQVDGTALAFPQEKIDLLTRLILDGSQWMTRGNATDFGAEGREITRKGQSTSHLVAAANNMLRLSTGREEEFRALAARAAGKPDAPPLVGNRHFWRADLMTHQRPQYYASARMHSTRLANTDGPANSEGLLSHHLADGCLVLMQTGQEYRDIYGVWDWQKIPGTTVRQKPELAGSPRRMGTTDFVGGVSDGTYGLAACDFERDGLTAKKSWFFFDDEIVCLGADIRGASDDRVVTTLNQCHFSGDVTLAEAGGAKTVNRGEHTSPAAHWIWHDSAAYVFLEPARLHVQNGAKSGSWYASNRQYSPRQETRDLFTAWIDHGSKPVAAGYAYAVVPGVDVDRAAKYAAEPPFRVLANREKLQAVWHERLGLVAAAFYQPGSLSLGSGRQFRVDTACLVLAKEQAGKFRITVSNPKNEAGEIRLDVTGPDGQEQKFRLPLPAGTDAGSSVSQVVGSSVASRSVTTESGKALSSNRQAFLPSAKQPRAAKKQTPPL